MRPSENIGGGTFIIGGSPYHASITDLTAYGGLHFLTAWQDINLSLQVTSSNIVHAVQGARRVM